MKICTKRSKRSCCLSKFLEAGLVASRFSLRDHMVPPQSQYDLEIANRKIGKRLKQKIQLLPRPDLSDAPTSS